MSGVLTVAVPSLPPPRMLSRWILIVWWGVAALSSAGQLGLGALELRIERCGDRLHITVRDNGPGLDRAALPFGSAASPGKAGLVAPPARDGIGLSNTAARLAQLYPGRSALRLADHRERGTVAVVELPYRTLDEEAGA